MPVQFSFVQGLEQASQRHEKEIVIDLNSDRIAHHAGLYFSLLLGIIAKANELAGSTLSCYPINKETGYSDFAGHAISYCWDSYSIEKIDLSVSGVYKSNFTCDTYDEESRVLFQDPDRVKGFIQWMPYALILQACLFALPSVIWHFRFGASLLEHLKFMQSLIVDVYKDLKSIPAGIYQDKAFDEEGRSLNGWQPFYVSLNVNYMKDKPEGSNASKYDENNSFGNRRRGEKNEGKKKIYQLDANSAELSLNDVVHACANAELSEDDSDLQYSDEEEENKETYSELNIFEKCLLGDVRDRNLLSMLCYENFASMEQYPYILSVFKLTFTPEAENDPKGVVPLLQGIHRMYFHRKNLTGCFLIKTYFVIKILSILLGLIALVIALQFGDIVLESLQTITFKCEVPYHDICLACVLRGTRDVMATFVGNFLIIVVYTGFSTYQFIFVRFGSKRALCKYFEVMSNFNVALLSAHKFKQSLAKLRA